MTIRVMAVLLMGIGLAGAAGPAVAECRFIMDCSGRPCRQIQECDSALDPPAVPSPGTGESAAPNSLTPRRGVSPLMQKPPIVPPPGNSGCRTAYICVASRCAWQNVCN